MNVQKTFWKLWKTGYLLSLREHHQKTKGRLQEVIKVGDVVQIHDEGKRSGWKLAIVEGLVRGSDGVVRSADLKTARGKTDRPISKLYPIEVHIQKEAEPVAEALPEPTRRPVRAAAEAARIRIIETAAEEED